MKIWTLTTKSIVLIGKILDILQKDARTPYLEIARKLVVSGGTVHQRMDRLKSLGIVKGSKIELDYSKLGYDVTVMLGLHLKSAKELPRVIDRLKKFDEVVEPTTQLAVLLVCKSANKNHSKVSHFLS